MLNCNWKCARCNGTVIEEVVDRSIVYRRVDGLGQDHQLILGPVLGVNDGFISHYRCSRCLDIVVDEKNRAISSRKDLAEYLNKQKKLKR